MQLVSSPTDVVAGVTPELTVTCTPGDRDDLSEIIMMQINHLVNGTKVAVADVSNRHGVQQHDHHTSRLHVTGSVTTTLAAFM